MDRRRFAALIPPLILSAKIAPRTQAQDDDVPVLVAEPGFDGGYTVDLDDLKGSGDTVVVQRPDGGIGRAAGRRSKARRAKRSAATTSTTVVPELVAAPGP